MFGTVLGDIAGTIYFLIFQISGICLSMLLLRNEKEKCGTKLIFGSVFGSAMLHWLPIIFSFVFDFTVLAHLLGVFVAFAVILLYIMKRSKAPNKINIEGIKKALSANRIFAIIMCGLFALWCYLLYTHVILLKADGAIYTGQCDYGDMNMHLGFITSIAVQKTFPADYSIFPGTKLAYPFLSDSISSSIYIWGASLRWAFILPMLTAFVQVVSGFYILAKEYLVSVKKSILAVVLFFLNGGLGFFYFLNWSSEGQYTFEDLFTGFYKTPTNLVGENIRWVNVIADMLLPQRATLFGYAMLIPAIYLLYCACFKNKKNYYYIAALLGGSLPLIHTHSFLAFGLVSASFLLMKLYGGLSVSNRLPIKSWHIVAGFAIYMMLIQYFLNKEVMQMNRLMPMTIAIMAVLVAYGLYLIYVHVKENGIQELCATWGVFLLIVFALALPQLLGFTFGQVSEGGFVRGYFNWGNQGEFYPWFYIKNMGIVLIFAVAALVGADGKAIRFAFPVFPLWLLVETIAFAPNTYDNNKLLYVAYMFITIIAADYMVNLFDRVKSVKGTYVLAAFVMVFALLSGVLTLVREVVSEYQLYGTDQVEMAKWIEANASENATILSDTRHNNIIASMTGRNIVCGSGSFLYFHGIDASKRSADLRLMYEAPEDNMALYEKYNVEYVCVSAYERGSYLVDEDGLSRLFEVVFESAGTKVYQVK